jgi:hypothetical protein
MSTAEFSKRPNQFGVRNGDEILRIEHAHAQEGTDTAASNRDWRGLVVCGTSVTKARSLSSAGMLMTSAGRTFAAMPRSTNQTSPRRGDVIQAARDDRVR